MKNLFTIFIIALFISFPNINFGQQSNCLNFDGTDDYIDLQTISPTGNFSTGFTYEGWIKWSSFDSAARLIDFGVGTADHLIIRVNDIAPTIRVEMYNNQTPGVADFTTECVLETWYHIAVTVETSTVKLYIDGELIDSKTIATTIRDVARTSCFLGKSYWADPYFNGYMDEVRLWSTVRTQAEIRNYMHNPLYGNEAGLVAYYNFNQGDAENPNGGETTLTDLTTNTNTGTLTNFTLNGTTSNWVDGHKNAMQLVYNTTLEAGTTITLPLFGVVDVVVDWGDGNTYPTTTPARRSLQLRRTIRQSVTKQNKQ